MPLHPEQHFLDAPFQDGIDDKEEDRSQDHHDQHHDGRDHRLLPGGPSDLPGFLADFLEEFEWVCLGHSVFRCFRGWQGRRVSNPRPAVLETAALPTELHPYQLLPYSTILATTPA